MRSSTLVVRFRNPAKTVALDRDLLAQEIERFAAADPRWRNLLEMAAAALSAGARETLAVAVSGLEAGPAPRLLSYDFEPDDEERIAREAAHMEAKLRTGLDLLASPRLGRSPRERLAVRGTVTALHRLLRIAKTRP